MTQGLQGGSSGVDFNVLSCSLLEMCDKYSKTCECEDVPVIYDMTLLTTNATYYGIDETDVNATLNSLGTWDSEAIKLLCKSKNTCPNNIFYFVHAYCLH